MQPRYAKLLNADRIHARLGRPPQDADSVPVEGSLAPSPVPPPSATTPKAATAAAAAAA